jgi:pyridoxamine 5'-phosphate oxidase
MNERDKVWDALREGAQKRQHPFHHAAVLSIDDLGFPSGRMMTLREADEPALGLRFHLDRRSAKFREWLDRPQLAVLFYDIAGMWQIRARGRAELHWDNNIAAAAWAATHPMAQRTYLTEVSPGEELDWERESTYPQGLEAKRPTPEQSALGYTRFGVLWCRVEEWDSLHLRGTGHERLHLDELVGSISRLAP